MTIIEQAKGLADKVLAQPATEHDIAVVERQLDVTRAAWSPSEPVAYAAGLWLWSPGRCFQAVSRSRRPAI